MLGVVKLASLGLAVQLYPVAPPLAVKVVEAPAQILTGELTVNPVGLVNTILVCETKVPALSVTETV